MYHCFVKSIKQTHVCFGIKVLSNVYIYHAFTWILFAVNECRIDDKTNADLRDCVIPGQIYQRFFTLSCYGHLNASLGQLNFLVCFIFI